MKRAMCVYLPAWPLQRLWHARPELRGRPVAIAQPGPRGAQVLWCSVAGIHRGMPVAEARATSPTLDVHDDDPARDRLALQKLAGWAERFSPIVGLEEGDAPECLFLDITGCADCFHGEGRLIERALSDFQQQGWSVHIAVAGTIGLAWGLAHYQESGGRSQESGVRSQEPALLPTASLRLPDDALQTLTALGIERVGQLLDMPRDHLAIRVGPAVLRRLDQLLGKVPELIVPCRLPAEVQARCSFEYATDNWKALDHALDHLLGRIVALLSEHQRGARHLECWFYHEGAAPSRVDVRLFRPSHSVDHLRKLLGTRLEQVRFTAPVCGICLRVPIAEIMAGRQAELFDEAPREEELAALIDGLVSRLGREAVTFATLAPDPQPEYACRFDPAVGEGREKKGEGRGKKTRARRAKKNLQLTIDNYQLPIAERSISAIANCQLSFVNCQFPLPSRPSSLAPHPEPIDLVIVDGVPARLRHAGKEHGVLRTWGPERIAAGWWRGEDVERDYYVVETDGGARWWIFRRLGDGRWFVHGWFD